MRRIIVRGIVILVGGVALLLGAGAAGALIRWDRTFGAPYPDLRASGDPALIARGKYLAYGPAHCATCHALPGTMAEQEPAVVGGLPFPIPGGIVYTPNITPDSATGIGRLTDGEIARTLRYGVKHTGRAMIPFMEFEQLADRDIVALLSWIRANRAVRHEVPRHRLGLVSKALLAYAVHPKAPQPAPAAMPEAVGIERGDYLVNAVARCVSCHTQRSPTGGYTGPRMAGGFLMADEADPDFRFSTPNLTPDTATGRIARWSEAEFIARIRQGRALAGSPMPWESYARMNDDDLRSIYAYLRHLPPVRHVTTPTRRPAK